MRSVAGCAFVAAAMLLVHTRPCAASDPPAVDETPAQRYARHSISIFASPELSAPNSATVRVLLDGVVRGTFWRGFAAQIRLGFGFSFSALASAAELNVRPGASIGYAIPLSRNVALTPNVGYDVFLANSVFAGGLLVTHRVGIELPVAVVVDSTLVEPFLLAGATFFEGQPDLALAIGVRIGLSLPTARHARPLPPPVQTSVANPSASNTSLASPVQSSSSEIPDEVSPPPAAASTAP